GIGRRFFRNAHRTRGRENDDGAKPGGCGLVRCSANRRSASTICARQARTAENEGERTRKISGRTKRHKQRKAVRDLAWGRTAARTSCRPTKGRFPPSAASLGTRDDRFGQPEADK